jgi:hypothetical protein
VRAEKEHLIIYAKAPRAGYAKTRLAATLGNVGASGVYARLLYAYLFDLLETYIPGRRIEISVATASDVSFFAAAFPELNIQAQVEGNLGKRMAASFQRAFEQGAESAVLTGSDIPGLDADLVEEAFAALRKKPAVIGPAEDGGYYLLGMRSPGAPLFDGITWSTEHVLDQTERLAHQQGIAVHYLPTLFDIDDGDDYSRWIRQLGLVSPLSECLTLEGEDRK